MFSSSKLYGFNPKTFNGMFKSSHKQFTNKLNAILNLEYSNKPIEELKNNLQNNNEREIIIKQKYKELADAKKDISGGKKSIRSFKF
jgi:hypothetical protein